MSLLAAENLQLVFGPKVIFDGAGFMIYRGDRVGVIGPNGTGKSTLFRVIMGLQELDGGKLHFAQGIRLGHLPQDILEVGGGTVLGSTLAAVPGRAELERNLLLAEDAIHAARDPDEQLELAQEIADLHALLERFETEYSPYEAERILMGLGFRTSDFDRPLGELSGGWKMRAALAGLLFKRPDLLLLDEPTNHLDVPTVAWLDEFLRGYQHTIMLITHDSAFLDRQVSRVLSFEVEGLRAYPGNYEQYFGLREQELEVRRAARRNQDAEIRQAKTFIRRFRAKATKARQVQSRIKKIEKIELVEVDHDRATIDFVFPPCSRTGKIAINLEEVDKSFGELRLYRKLSAHVVSGDRIAIIGRNGAGKTTLLRIMAGELPFDAGRVEFGANVEIGYYAQHLTEKLDAGNSILTEVWRTVPAMSQTAVRGVCGAFLFSGEEVDKQVSVLSGGEKARVSLAKLLVRPGNVLLMDEPTNHLDLFSAEALAEALDTYDGTLAFVSHTRAFINRLATKIWNIEEGRIDVFPGNLDDYLYHLDQVQRKQNEAEAEEPPAEEEPANPKPKAVDYEQRKRLNRERARLERAIRQAEEKIAELEKRIGDAETKRRLQEADLAKPEIYQNPERFNRLLGEFEKTKAEIDRLTPRWEKAAEEVEKLQKQLAKLPLP